MTPKHFELNCTINAIAGNTPLLDITDREAIVKVTNAQIPLILSEHSELVKGINNKNHIEIRDGLADIIVTCDGLISRLGFTQYEFGYSPEHMLPVHLKFFNTAKAKYWHLLLRKNIWRMESILRIAEGPSDAQDIRNRAVHCAIAAINAVAGFSSITGIDVMRDQYSVYVSNLSKFDTDPELAKQSAAKYQNMGVEVVIEPCEHDGVTYYVVKSKINQVVNGKDYPQGKFLKSLQFKEPILEPLQESAILDAFLEEQA